MPPFPLLFYFKLNFFAIRISVFCVFHLKNDRQLISSKKCTRINRELFRRSMTGKPLSAGSPMLHRWGGTPRLHFPCSWAILLERSPGRSRLWGCRLHLSPLGHPLCPRWIENWKLSGRPISRVSHGISIIFLSWEYSLLCHCSHCFFISSSTFLRSASVYFAFSIWKMIVS